MCVEQALQIPAYVAWARSSAQKIRFPEFSALGANFGTFAGTETDSAWGKEQYPGYR